MAALKTDNARPQIITNVTDSKSKNHIISWSFFFLNT